MKWRDALARTIQNKTKLDGGGRKRQQNTKVSIEDISSCAWARSTSQSMNQIVLMFQMQSAETETQPQTHTRMHIAPRREMEVRKKGN